MPPYMKWLIKFENVLYDSRDTFTQEISIYMLKHFDKSLYI